MKLSLLCCLILAAWLPVPATSQSARDAGVAVGPQYGTTHVYIAPADFDGFINSFVATFGGTPSKRIVGSVLPVLRSRLTKLKPSVPGNPTSITARANSSSAKAA